MNALKVSIITAGALIGGVFFGVDGIFWGAASGSIVLLINKIAQSIFANQHIKKEGCVQFNEERVREFDKEEPLNAIQIEKALKNSFVILPKA